MLLALRSFCVKGKAGLGQGYSLCAPLGQLLVLPPPDLAVSGDLSPDGGGHCKHAIGKDAYVLSSTD